MSCDTVSKGQARSKPQFISKLSVVEADEIVFRLQMLGEAV